MESTDLSLSNAGRTTDRNPYPSIRRRRRNTAPAHLPPGRPAIIALAGLALLALLGPLPPPAQAVTCQPLQRGTLNADNTFRRGTSARHTDYRIICRGDGDGRAVREQDLDAAISHANADPLEDPSGGRLVLQLNNAHLNVWTNEYPNYDDPGGFVILGTVRGDSQQSNYLFVEDLEDWNRLNVDSHADVRTTGGGRGMYVWVEEMHNYGDTVRLRNFGSIRTQGGGPSQGNRRGAGLRAEASHGHGNVEAINEASGTVETLGPGARGIIAGTDNVAGTVTGMNRGSVITRANAYFDGTYLRGSDGIIAWADGSGTARVINEAGGTIETHGTGAKGLNVAAEGGATAAIAINRGRITTRGHTFTHGSDSRTADGVSAWSDSAVTRATNEARGIIRTHGTGARGLSAGNTSVGGRAEAENWGRITTSGGRAGTRRAGGVNAWSEQDSAIAVNHAGATVTTSGRGAYGIVASTDYGSHDESAVALNRGTISTRGNAFHTATRVYSANGVAVYSGGEAPAVAINAYEGEIEIRGSGAKGVVALIWRGGGAAHARNRGRITTHGDLYTVDRPGTDNDTWTTGSGLVAYSSANSDATATNEVGGVIETHGTAAFGIQAWTDGGGTAKAINRGRVTTRGAAVRNVPVYTPGTLGSEGVRAYSGHADALVENSVTGVVETRGARAFALFALTDGDGSRTSALAEVINRGQAETHGVNADGAIAISAYSENADNPNHVRATNLSGATITTAGVQSTALAAGIGVSGGGTKNAHGTAIARNHGTVITAGADGGSGAGSGAANGVAAAFFRRDNTKISRGGDVTIVNTGDVTVKGVRASALYAETFGRGTVTVWVLGGKVRAEHGSGRGLWARTGGAGRVNATIAGGAEVAARNAGGIAAQFQGGTTNVRLLDSTLSGRVVFGRGRDTFTLRNGRVTGAINFAGGADVLNVHGDSWLEGAITNIETFNKRGTGNVVVNSAHFSSGGNAVLENGGLTFTGQFNLGQTGTMRIHDSARLSAVLANPDSPPRITAGGGLTFEGDKELFVQVAPGVSAQNERTWLNGFRNPDVNPIANGTPVQGLPGPVALRSAHGPSRVVEVGWIPLQNGATRTAGTNVRSGVRLGVIDPDAPEDFLSTISDVQRMAARSTSSPDTASDSFITMGGGVSALGAALFDVFDTEAQAFALDEVRDDEAPALPTFVGTRVKDGGLEYWARSWGGETPVLAGGIEASARGMALGVNAHLGEGFQIGVSTAPYGQLSGADARIDGTRYTIRGSWRGEIFHTAASLSRGQYRAQSIFDNPVAGGGLGGAFDLTQNHSFLGMGAYLNSGGALAVPSLSVFSGALRQDAYTAVGPVFRAEVPAYSQRYYGWKGALSLSPAQWFRSTKSLRWRPALRLFTQRTWTKSPLSLDVAQHDRAGVLSLDSRAKVTGLPRTVHGLSATMDVANSEDWRLQISAAGLRADGEFRGALFTRLNLDF